MSEATQRVFRAVNEQIVRVQGAFGADLPLIDLICECVDPTCIERIPSSRGEYERVRDSSRFLMLPGHDLANSAATSATSEHARGHGHAKVPGDGAGQPLGVRAAG